MTDAPDPQTIDFAKVLAGLDLPKDTVTVNLSEKIGYAVHKITTALAGLDPKDDKDEIEGLKASLSEIAKDAKATEYTFHMTAVDREVRRNLATQVRTKYAVETNAFGRPLPNPEAEEAYTSGLWALHIEKVEGPGVTMDRPSPESLVPLIAKAPDKAVELVDAKITELSGEGATDGFDTLIRDADFLSQR